MLILAEGTVHRPVVGDQLAAMRAWLGPMADSGFLHAGYADHATERLWLVITSDSVAEANQRLADLPEVRDGAVSFTLIPVHPVRFR
jgi:hypothetical protein